MGEVSFVIYSSVVFLHGRYSEISNGAKSVTAVGGNSITTVVVVVVVFTLKTVLTSIQYPSLSYILFKAKKRISVVTS